MIARDHNSDACGGARAPSEAVVDAGFVLQIDAPDPFDQLPLLDARDYLQPPAAAHALLDLDPEYALQAPRPAQRHVLRHRALRLAAARLRASLPPA